MDDVARFEIREELTRDPRFVRLRAFDRRLQCEVLLEQPGPAVAARLSSTSGERALREARVLARIQHPRVIRLREVVELDGLPTLVLDPLRGERLDAVLAREGRLDAGAVARLGRDVAQGVQAVHAEGIVHRGIAPENIWIDVRDGGAVLSGFTFAKPVDVKVGQSSLDHRRRTDGGPAVQGLPEYAAPEQVAGQPADHRADVFGLGCLLYRCATGQDAFPPEAVSMQAPPPPHKLDRGIPRALSEVICKCIAHSPLARYPNMLAVDEALAALDAARPPRRPWIAIAGAAGLAAAAVLVWIGTADPLQRGVGDDTARHQPPELGPAIFLDHYVGRRAVVVGIDYAGSPHLDGRRLKNAERDARAIEERLLALGWKKDGPEPELRTLLGSEASYAAILDGVQWAEQAGRDAQVFVYLAGHGEQHPSTPNSGWFVPYDGDTERHATLVMFDQITKALLYGKGDAPKHVLIALDCCESGAAIPDRGRPVPRGAEKIALPELQRAHIRQLSRTLLTSAYGAASDGKGQHSPFAQGFLQALDRAVQGQPVISSGIFASVYASIYSEAGDQCCWWTELQPGVEFAFLPREKR